MRVAFLSDIHGNLVALRQVLDSLSSQHLDAMYFLGDAVGYFPEGKGVILALEQAGVTCQQGNHEAMMLQPSAAAEEYDEVYRLKRTLRELPAELVSRIRTWPTRRVIALGEATALLIHGSPRDDLFEYVYPDTDLDQFGRTGYDFVIMGNTHRPFIRTSGRTVYANVGSVGMPRDQGNLAAVLTFDSVDRAVRVLRISLDVDQILGAYPDVHPTVAACLRRRELAPIGEQL